MKANVGWSMTWAAISLAAVIATPVAGAAPLACADPLLVVDADTREMAEQVCAIALKAKQSAQRCSLVQRRPVTLKVQAHIDGPAEHCAGTYVVGADQIEVIPPDKVPAVLPVDHAFSKLEPEVYYASLLVHELVHAFADQRAEAEGTCTADQEYIAYALQLDSLPDEAKQSLIAEARIGDPVEAGWLNEFVLALRPDRFALVAWAHFDAPNHGCDFVEDLLTGRKTLKLDDL